MLPIPIAAITPAIAKDFIHLFIVFLGSKPLLFMSNAPEQATAPASPHPHRNWRASYRNG
jgi:hypothetical protein